MALPTKQTLTLDAFYTFVHLPENAAKRFEFIDGEIIEVPSNSLVSVIAAEIIILLGIFRKQQKLAGYFSTEGGGYIIDGNVFAPDVAYVRELPAGDGYEPTPPLLVVEVISNPRSNTEQTDLRRKLVHYMRAGVVVWVVDYLARQVEVHQPGEAVLVLGEGETLSGGTALPGLDLTVADIFPDDLPESESDDIS